MSVTLLKRLVLGFVFLFLLCLWSCQMEDKIQIKAYYFPVEELKEGLVYEYNSVGKDSLAPEYWYYKTFEQDSGLYFTGQYYNYDFEIGQFVSEEVVGNGTLLHQLFMYEPADSNGQQLRFSVEIEVPNVFPFEVRDSGGVFLYKIKWTSPSQPERRTRLIRNRRYLGKRPYEFNGEQHEAIAFSTRDLIETNEEGYQELQYDGEEIYAKGIGLVYYRKAIDSNLVLEYQLKGRYKMEELEKKFAENLKQR
ncbi:MAG: hypothetical protein AAGG75_22635 [Bacteroidota bacterium]